MKRVALILIAVLFSAAAQAAPIVVHNTGVDAADAVVAPGHPTAFWTLTTQPAASGLTLGSTPFRFRAGPYYADTATSAWVAPSASGIAGAIGHYIYTLPIDLTGLDAASAVITGEFGTDNQGSVSLNDGAPVAVAGLGDFGSPIPFTIGSGFVDGINFIHVDFNNAGDPSAFHVRFISATAVPEPTTLALLGAGVAGLARIGRRRIRS